MRTVVKGKYMDNARLDDDEFLSSQIPQIPQIPQ